MTEQVHQSGSGTGVDVVLRPVGPDDWSHVRHVHAAALQRLAGMLVGSDTKAIQDMVYAPEYCESMQRENLWGAWVGDMLAGTAGWVPSDDSGASARVTSLLVNPLMLRLGIGRRLLDDAESRARAAGFQSFTTRATQASIGFYESVGYEISSYGVQALRPELAIPVVFMRKRDGTANRKMSTKTEKGAGSATERAGKSISPLSAVSPASSAD